MASLLCRLLSLFFFLLRVSFSLVSVRLTPPTRTATPMPPAPAPNRPISKRTATANIILPDLVSHCNFKLHHNRHRKQVTVETMKWLFKGDNLCSTQRDAFRGLNAGLLTSMCYPNAGYSQLRAVNDFLTYLFYLDNLSDDMDNRGTKFIGDAVMNSLYHPYAHRSSTRVGRMAAEYVTTCATTFPRFIPFLQLLQTHTFNCVARHPATLSRDI